MQAPVSKNQRIFKNTIILYVRMVVVLLISLYTSRVVLQALGVDDFGLYSVVGGVVGLLSFFSVTMSRSTQRFLNTAMVKGEDSLSQIFASSITVHLLFAVLFLLLGETLGLWFLNTHVNISGDRMFAANIVYQASLVSFCVAVIGIPYKAAIIAYEKMSFLAFVSILDAFLQLGIAFFLVYSSGDRLILYSILLFGMSIINFFLFFSYCGRYYKFLKFRISKNRNDFKQIFGFVSWSLLGESAQVGCNQGNVVLVNIFHSLAANAAMSVGGQVNNALYSLTSNFQTAFSPQITKSYAESDYDYLKKLVYTTSKLSFCILFVVALPVSFNIDWLLDIWLDQVPAMSNTFAVLFLVNALLNAIGNPFHFVVLASGRIRNFQIISSVIYLLDLPITYLLFKMGLPAPTVLWVKISTMILIVGVRISYASRIVPSMTLLDYGKQVFLPLLVTFVFSVSLAFFFNGYAGTIGLRLLYTVVIELVCCSLLWWWCIKKQERNLLLNYLKIKK